ncbi:MAG: class I SAM-dependent methyltransferase [Bacteroidetes bacterium]|nr:class I SAM-dependent methyltransferase [Bacteroidota bacterium]MDA1121042.1 class I SAM-dependent methyltransferase [Bacteroidota bacterium]
MALSESLNFYRRYIRYWLTAVDAHSLHFPFIFRFYVEVIAGKSDNTIYKKINKLRAALANDQRVIQVNDLGAGSRVSNVDQRTIAQIFKSATSDAKLSMLLYRIGKYIGARNILELGTSLGVTTEYLALIESTANIYTIEGSEEIQKVAKDHLNSHNNVVSYLGDIDVLLPQILSQMPFVDLAYIDANHTFEATLEYFKQIMAKRIPSTVIVVGDIHWSDGMEKAWAELKSFDEVTLSLDLFECGLLFFMPAKYKQDYVTRF